jgi:CMD domain protein
MIKELRAPRVRDAGDVIAQAAGLADASELQRLRRRRAAVTDHAQSTLVALLDPDDPGQLSLVERAAMALRVAVANEDHELQAWYRTRLSDVGAAPALVDAVERRRLAARSTPRPARRRADERLPDRLDLMLDHVDWLAVAPGRVGPDHLRALEAAGLGEPELVTISQIAAFVSYQVRVTSGLRAIADLP